MSTNATLRELSAAPQHTGPLPGLLMDAAAHTDTGRTRRNNQDAFASDARLGLYVVCDGMGGAAAGDVASRLAADTFLAVARHELLTLHVSDADCTRHALHRAAAAANRAVVDAAAASPHMRGMGSTLVAACIRGGTATVVNVGDSRAYLLRQGRVSQLTDDHSYVAEQVRLGIMSQRQAETSSWQSVITRAIGAAPDVHPDLYTVPLHPFDTLLLTSDGLTRHVKAPEIAAVLAASAALTAQAACSALIDLANERGGSDNITCFVLRMG